MFCVYMDLKNEKNIVPQIVEWPAIGFKQSKRAYQAFTVSVQVTG